MARISARGLRGLLKLVFTGTVIASCLAMTGCTLGGHEPYSQDFSSVETLRDFSLGGDDRFVDKLQPGKENILMFWGSWCPHCESLIDRIGQMDNPEVVLQHLFTVAEDESLDDIEAHKTDFPIYLDQDESVYEMYQLEHIPTVFIFDDQGEVLGSAQGEEDSFALLQEYAKYNG